jgi:hypothetical protein
LKRLQGTTNTLSSNSNNNKDVNELNDENSYLKNEVNTLRETLESQQIHQLQLRIKELEDWNGDDHGLLFNYSFKNHSNLFFKMSLKRLKDTKK